MNRCDSSLKRNGCRQSNDGVEPRSDRVAAAHWLDESGRDACLIALTFMLGAGSLTWLACMRKRRRRSRSAPWYRHGGHWARRRPAATPHRFRCRTEPAEFLCCFRRSDGSRTASQGPVHRCRRDGSPIDQGEYKWELEKDSRTYRYQFSCRSRDPTAFSGSSARRPLLALPFASLDELSFKRESIGDDTNRQHLRFTFYLKDSHAH